MDNAWRFINSLVSELTTVVIGLLGLGVVAGILFGDFFGCLLYTSDAADEL